MKKRCLMITCVLLLCPFLSFECNARSFTSIKQFVLTLPWGSDFEAMKSIFPEIEKPDKVTSGIYLVLLKDKEICDLFDSNYLALYFDENWRFFDVSAVAKKTAYDKIKNELGPSNFNKWKFTNEKYTDAWRYGDVVILAGVPDGSNDVVLIGFFHMLYKKSIVQAKKETNHKPRFIKTTVEAYVNWDDAEPKIINVVRDTETGLSWYPKSTSNTYFSKHKKYCIGIFDLPDLSDLQILYDTGLRKGSNHLIKLRTKKLWLRGEWVNRQIGFFGENGLTTQYHTGKYDDAGILCVGSIN